MLDASVLRIEKCTVTVTPQLKIQRLAPVPERRKRAECGGRGAKSDLWDAPTGVTVLKYALLGSRESVQGRHSSSSLALKRERFMPANVRTLFWIEASLAVFCGALAVITIFWQDWIEALTGYDPDQHDGSVEWLVVVGLFVACACFSIAARAQWRRLRPARA